jgi:hypothetical protein
MSELPTEEMIDAGDEYMRHSISRSQIRGIYNAMQAVTPGGIERDNREAAFTRAGINIERRRCVNLLIASARASIRLARLAEDRDRQIAYQAMAGGLMLSARELYGPRKGDDNGNG